MSKRSSIFSSVRTEGAILPAELLTRIVSGDPNLEGIKPTDYHLSPGERLGEAATRSWNRLIGVWQTFQEIVDVLPEEAIGTKETRERWLLPLFQELGYGRLQIQRSVEIDGKSYPISHKASEPVAIHLVSFKWDLDRRPTSPSHHLATSPSHHLATSPSHHLATSPSHHLTTSPSHHLATSPSHHLATSPSRHLPKFSPHSLMQEYLNSSEHNLWGILSNGYKLRILRDNVSLTRAAYVEFDLQAMMDGLAYSDFFLLYLLCHQSRVEVKADDAGRLLPLQTCWLEKWYNTAIKDGVRALDDLRNNVQSAIESLGAGFLSHPGNTALRDKLRHGTLTLQDYYHQVLLQVYRLLFIFVAEDRDLLIPDDVPDNVKQAYLKHYSSYRIRDLASKKRGTRHSDLWHQFVLLFKGLYDGNTALGLPALGSFLFSNKSTQDLADIAIANSDLLSAIRFLCYTQQNNVFQSINYRNLGSEELGSVYESLLEMHPEINLEAGYFKLNLISGSQRKTTGSYYTPSSLVNSLLDSALEPVIANALKQPSTSPSRHLPTSPSDHLPTSPSRHLATSPSRHLATSPEQALLALKICDPACGSGHFLISAAHRIAKRLASIRAGEDEPAPSIIHQALRDVIGKCIYGVDINPMAVELCKISLWMEALEPGKPLTFLDHHIQCGNSLLGCTPALLKKGIPDAAFTPLTGDDKAYCAKYKKLNKEERDKDVLDIFSGDEKPWVHLGNHSPYIINLNKMDDSDIDALRAKEAAYAELMQSSAYLSTKFVFDSWCAAFVWKKAPSEHLPYPITQQLLDKIGENPYSVNPAIRTEIMRLAEEYQLFHWHIAFPDVFIPDPIPPSDHLATSPSGNLATSPSGNLATSPSGNLATSPSGNLATSPSGNLATSPPHHLATSPTTGWSGGFDCVLGNPPWERVKLQEKEFFAARDEAIAKAQNAASRKALIQALPSSDPELWQAFETEKRSSEASSQMIREGGGFPLCGRGDLNTYTVFAELNRILLSNQGRCGCIVPSGIATDDTTKYFFQNLFDTNSLVSLYDFENKRPYFEDVHRSFKFSLLTMRASSIHESFGTSKHTDFLFFAQSTSDLKDPDRHFQLTREDIALINPNTRTCPIFRNKADAELTKYIYRRVPVLINENDPKHGNPWGISFLRMLDMSNDSHLFRTREQLENHGLELTGNRFEGKGQSWLPLYEAKMIHHYNHRFGDYMDLPDGSSSTQLPEIPLECLQDADYEPLPRYWVAVSEVERAAPDNRKYYMGFRDITNITNERTVIGSVLPKSAVGNNLPIWITTYHATEIAFLVSCLSSYAMDFVSRFKVGGTHLNFFIAQQLCVIPPSVFVSSPFYAKYFLPRALELIYTSRNLSPFAQDCGYDGQPFIWDEYRRFVTRCELDALFFHLYLGSDSEWQGTTSLSGHLATSPSGHLANSPSGHLATSPSGHLATSPSGHLDHFPTPRHAIDYIMDTFPIIKRKDEKEYGEYRTKLRILEIYDQLTHCIAADTEYRSALNPPPGPPCDAKGNFIPVEKWDRNNWPKHIHHDK